jgi:hypothetical protein
MSAIVLTSKPGLQSVSALAIPTTWDQTWFKNFVSNVLKGGDVRNAIAGPGITITGNLASPYATISLGGAGPVTLPGTVTITTPAASGSTLIVQPANGTTNPSQLVEGTSAQSDGYLGFKNTTTGIYIGGIGGGGTLAGAGVNDLQFWADNAALDFGTGNGTNILFKLLNAQSGQIIAVNNTGGSGGAFLSWLSGGTEVGFIGNGTSVGGVTANDFAIGCDSGTTILHNAPVVFPNVGTTASAANAFLNSASSPANSLLRSTSSLRYKTNVATIQAADLDALLQMRPVTYTSLSTSDNPTTVHLGFIAEEIATIDSRLVTYIPTTWQMLSTQAKIPAGSATAPDSVQYERITALLVGAVQALAARVSRLEAPASATTITKQGQYVVTGTQIFTGALAPITTLPVAVAPTV